MDIQDLNMKIGMTSLLLNVLLLLINMDIGVMVFPYVVVLNVGLLIYNFWSI